MSSKSLVYAVNCREFSNNEKSQISEILKKDKPLVCISSFFDRRYFTVFDGYNMANDHTRNNGQQGVAVYVQEDYDYEIREDVDRYAKEGVFQIAYVEIPIRKLVVVGICRSPDTAITDFNMKLDQLLKLLSTKGSSKRLIIGGDWIDESVDNTSTENVLISHGLEFSVTRNLKSSPNNLVTNIPGASTGETRHCPTDNRAVVLRKPPNLNRATRTGDTTSKTRPTCSSSEHDSTSSNNGSCEDDSSSSNSGSSEDDHNGVLNDEVI